MFGDLTLPIPLLLLLFVGHWIGDFVFQTDAMAKGKSKDSWILIQHVARVTATLGAMTLAWALLKQVPAVDFALFLALNFAAHFATDYVTSRWTTRLWFLELNFADHKTVVVSDEGGGHEVRYPTYFVNDKGTRHDFFVVIGFDQLLHMVVLVLSATLLV